MLRKFNILDAFLFLYVIYSLQGFMYASGSILSQSVVFLICVIGAYAMSKILFLYDNPIGVKSLIILFLIIALTFLLSDKTVCGTRLEAIGTVKTIDQLKGCCLFFFPFFISYVYCRSEEVSDKKISTIAIILFVTSCISYYTSYRLYAEHAVGDAAFTNNGAYTIVNVLPFLPFLLRNRYKLAFSFLVVSAILIIKASKRGAIVCLAACFVFSVYYYLFHNKKLPFELSPFKKFLIVFAAFCLVSIAYYFFLSNDYLLDRLESTQSSGIGARELAYSILWSHWYNDSNFLTFFFGNGMAKTITIWGNYAHNDWLELLIDHGFIGILFYFLFFLSIVLYIQKMKLDFFYKWSAYTCMIIAFLKTLFSMGYTDWNSGTYMFLLGMIIGCNVRYIYNNSQELVDNAY